MDRYIRTKIWIRGGIYNRGVGATTVANFSAYELPSDYDKYIEIYEDSSKWNTTYDSIFYSADSEDAEIRVIESWYSSEGRISTLPEDADLVIIDIGVNDFFRAMSLAEEEKEKFIGEFHSYSAYGESIHPYEYDDSKYIDALCLLIKRVQVQCPNAKIIMWGMPYNLTVANMDSDGEYIDNKDICDSIREANKEVCGNLGIKYIDMYAECGVNLWNIYDYFEDGVHPYHGSEESIAGAYMIADVLTAYIAETYPLPENVED